jgi:hypothetical protein
MANRMLLSGVVVVVVIIIIASVAYTFYHPSSQPSALEQMSLTDDEFGSGWQSQITMEPYDPPMCENWLLNDSYNAYIWLVSYNNTYESWHWYESEMEQIHENENYTFLNIMIGDDSFLCYYGTLEQPSIHLVFIKDNIFCTIYAGSVVYFAQSWWIDTTIWIAQLQIEKIDQYLAEHTGAN